MGSFSIPLCLFVSCPVQPVCVKNALYLSVNVVFKVLIGDTT